MRDTGASGMFLGIRTMCTLLAEVGQELCFVVGAKDPLRVSTERVYLAGMKRHLIWVELLLLYFNLFH